jgi:hypothetical protein
MLWITDRKMIDGRLGGADDRIDFAHNVRTKRQDWWSMPVLEKIVTMHTCDDS